MKNKKHKEEVHEVVAEPVTPDTVPRGDYDKVVATLNEIFARGHFDVEFVRKYKEMAGI